MKKFTRRFSAVVLSAALALASPCALANEYSAAQVMITAQDGSQQALHVQMAVTSSGDTVYWMDISQMTDEQIMALEMGLLVVTDESGAVVMQIPLQGANILDSNGLVELAHPEDPEITYPLVLGQMPMPEDAAEVEGIVEAYMFENEDAYDDGAYDEESYDEEAYDEETYDEEPYVEESYDEEVYDEESYVEESYDEEAYDEEPYVEESYDEETYDEEPYVEETYDEEAYDEESYDEEAARIEAEQEAARRAAEEEAARKAAEEAARIAAESQSGDETADNAPNETVEALTVPQYVIPNSDATNLRSETSTASDDTVLTQVNTNDVLNVYGYVQDTDGNVWWQVEDYRTGYVGYILSSVVSEGDEDAVVGMMEAIEAEEYEEEEPEVTEPEMIEPEETEPETTEPEITESETTESEVTEPENEELEETEQDEPVEIVEPEYVTPNRNATNLRSEASTASDASVLTQVNEGDILAVFDYVYDDEGNVWWQVEDYRTGYAGYIMASVVSEVPADQMSAYIAAIDAQEETEEPEITEPEIIEPEIIEPEITEPEIIEPEETEPEIDEPEITEPEVTEPEADAEEDAEDVEEEAQPEEDESESVQPEADVNYGQTNNKNSDESNLRAEPNSKGAVVGKYKNGELLIVGEPSNDGKWYPVTVVSDGNQGYMRDYIIGAISKIEAQERMAEMLGDKVIASQQPQEEDSSDETVETVPPADVWEDEDDTADDEQDIEPDDVQDADDAGDDWQDEEPAEGSEEADDAPASQYPLYAMTLDQDNKAVIVLVEAPGALPPQMGNIDPITGPTPLEILSEKTDAAGVLWYEVRNMSTDTTGYVEAFKVELVDKAVAQENVKAPVADLIKPIPPQNEEEQEPEKEPEATPEPTPEPTPTPEPDIPQELTQGDVYHYGRNTGRQVALREKPNSNGKLHYRMEKGTVLWVMKTEGDWCYVRTDKGEGYVKAEFVELMDVREEEEYRATLDDPEIVPEKPAEDETQDDALVELVKPEPEVQEPVDTTPKELDVYTRVLANMTPLRSNPDENAQMQTMLSAETVLYAVQSKANEDGTVWYLVRDEEMWGYVLEEQVAVMNEQETADYFAALEAAMATPTPTVEPTATPEPTTTPAPQRLGIYARVISDGTPLRGNPDPNAYLQNVLDEETVVYIFQSQVAADGMTWYLVQFSGQWGYIRADLVRPMGEQETADYLAQLEAELATPTPMPQVTPEPIGPDSTSAYAKLIKDAVNLRLTPSASGTSLGRIPVDTLLLVTGAQDDGAYTWYQVNYNGKDGFVRSDMAQMLTISELQDYLAEQVNATPKPGAAVTPNKNNNTSITINGSELKDLIPVDDSWTNNVISGMPDYATASPDPNTTPSPVPPANPAALIGTSGNISVSHVPSLTTDGVFTVYGRTKPYSTVTATVEVEAQTTGVQQTFGFEFVSRAIAEAMVKRTVGQAIAGADGQFTMSVKLPAPGGYIVEFATAHGDYARYGVTYDNGATPEPTIAPLPTVAPVQEDNGMGILPFVIGGLLIVIAAAAYGVYVYRRKAEEEEEDEEDEDEETELREEQLSYQRQRRAESSAQAMPPRMTKPQATQAPSYMKNTRMESEKREVSPYARPAAPQAPVRPQAPTAPQAPVRPQAPTAPQAPVRPQAPTAPQAPVRPQAPAAPQAPTAPQAPVTPADTAAQDGAPRRRRRPPTDMNA